MNLITSVADFVSKKSITCDKCNEVKTKCDDNKFYCLNCLGVSTEDESTLPPKIMAEEIDLLIKYLSTIFV